MGRQLYDDIKRAANQRILDSSQEARDIAPVPPVKSKKRRKEGSGSFRRFCEIYFPGRFTMSWSDDHVRAIERLEKCAVAGGLFAYAMPRGSGKTTLAECLAIWAVLTGRRRFVVLIGATESHAERVLESIKAEFESNELLLEDFPEACYPIVKLEGITKRCQGQILNGARTRIEWKQDAIALPIVPKSVCGGSVIRVTGITGSIRGMRHTGPDGKPIRPDLVILDDPQTDESAASPTQNAKREEVITKAVLGLAGPGKQIAAVMPCTIIAPDDMCERILDRQRNPEWQGETTKLVYDWPKRLDLWDKYAEIRMDEFRSGGDGSAATAFYVENRGAMDEGSRVAWPERHNPNEVSALQHAFNLKIRNPSAFEAEYQNNPQRQEISAGLKELDSQSFLSRTNRLARGVCPSNTTKVTAFVDVGPQVLWYAVVAWDESYNGALIDYGPYPKQSRSSFSASSPPVPLSLKHPGLTDGQRVFRAVTDLAALLCSQEYPRIAGPHSLRVDRLVIDSGYETQSVHEAVRMSPHAAMIVPSKGVARGNSEKTIMDWARKPGERRGLYYALAPVSGAGGIRGRLLKYDTDFWKTFAHDRLITPVGSGGALTIYGDSPQAHYLLAEHVTAEHGLPAEIKGVRFHKWVPKPARENHLFDCLVGCCVSACEQGIKWTADDARLAGKIKPTVAVRRSFAEMQAAKRAEQQGRRVTL